MTGLSDPPVWTAPSDDPNDEQFGDVVVPATVEEADEFPAVLVGEPYDGAVIGRPGAREGPAALREAVASTKTCHLERGRVGPVGDLGDVEIPEARESGSGARESGSKAGGSGPWADVRTVQDAVADVSREIYDVGGFPVFLGGDNSLSYPNARPLLSRGSLGVVSFDAHLDCREVREAPTSGTPYRQLHEDGLDAFAVVGARHFETSATYCEYVRERGGTIRTAEAVDADTDAVVASVLDEMAGVDAIYASVDLDVLDAAHAPGVSAPTPGGLTPRELFRMVRWLCADERVAGFEVVECAPPLDEGNRTTRAGARVIAHAIAGRQEAVDE